MAKSLKNKILIIWDESLKMTKAEKILQELIADIDLDYDDYEIVKTPMPKGKKFGKRELPELQEWFNAQVKDHGYKFVVVMGSNSYLAMTGAAGIKKARGKPVEHKGHIVLPMFHPNMAVHDESALMFMESDFRKLSEVFEFGGIPEERELDFEIVDTWGKVKAMLKDLRGTVSSDLETSRLYPFTTPLDVKIEKGEKLTAAEEAQYRSTHCDGKKNRVLSTIVPRVVAIQFGTAKKQWIIPAETAGIWSRKELEDIVEQITDKLEDCYLVGHNWKFDALWMKVRFGVDWPADFDTMLAHYLLDENDRHGLKYLAQKYAGAPDWDVAGDVKTSWSITNAKYAAHDVYYTRKLKFTFAKMMKEEGEIKDVFDKILMPCSRLFTEAEYDGIHIDLDKFDEAEKFLREQLAEAEEALEPWAHPEWGDIDKATGKPTINWGSPKQLGRLLFTDLKIPPVEKTAAGGLSTSESVLKRIDHPMVGALLKYRGHKQQLSFFIEGWKPYLDLNGVLHPSFKLIGTVTGRLSCEHPNLQQVPRDKRIRSLITAPEGWTLLEADLSQIELRIASELANEYTMLAAFRDGIDTHWLTAIREIERGAGYKDEVIETVKTWYKQEGKSLAGIKVNYSWCIEQLILMGPDPAADINSMWKEVRKKAKAINFGYLYGMWWKKFKIYARDNYGVDVTDKQAEESRKAFFALYDQFPKWHDRQRRFARMHGYVRSLSGRKRRLPAAMHREDTPQRREAERQAINSPVQSFANELNLMAALQLREEFGRSKVRLVGTVHDACLVKVRNDVLIEVHDRLLEIMSGPRLLQELEIELKVPIEADATIGPWGAGLPKHKWLAAQETVH